MTATVLLCKGWRKKAQANLIKEKLFAWFVWSHLHLYLMYWSYTYHLEGGRREKGYFFWCSVPHLCPQIEWEPCTAKSVKMRRNLINSTWGSFSESFLGGLSHIMQVEQMSCLPFNTVYAQTTTYRATDPHLVQYKWKWPKPFGFSNSTN